MAGKKPLAMDTYNSLVSGVGNFREAGGIKIASRHVKKGMLFRSGSLDNMEDHAKWEFDQLGIDYIFDFRSDDEVLSAPDYTGSSVYYHIPAITELPGSKLLGKLAGKKGGKLLSTTGRNNPADMAALLKKASGIPFLGMRIKRDFLTMYEKMPFNNAALREVFNRLDEGRSMLIHCQTGKDRTGVVAALILLALGADEATVITDYMLSNYYREKENADVIKRAMEATGSRRVAGLIKGILINREENIIRTLNSIKRKYGHYDNFFSVEYGVDAARLENWRKSYLE